MKLVCAILLLQENLMNNKKVILAAGGIFGFLGVALGAFGAHSLKDVLNSELLEVFRMGVFYQLIHSAVIVAIGQSDEREFYLAALFMIFGIILFSFSLYVYALSGVKLIAMVTPVGGISFLIGWLILIVQAFKKS
jgi:uncharacterized membrane protein YgdD (TMEM256/DUF423 family)